MSSAADRLLYNGGATSGRTLGVRFVWVYIILSFVIAVSVSFQLFLIARQRRLGQLG